MRDLRLWVRIGDQDNYHDFDSVDEAIGHVADCLHSGLDSEEEETVCVEEHQLGRYVGPGLYGIVLLGTEYQGDNGVSFFWGDDNAQFKAEISDQELETARRLVSAECEELN